MPTVSLHSNYRSIFSNFPLQILFHIASHCAINTYFSQMKHYHWYLLSYCSFQLHSTEGTTISYAVYSSSITSGNKYKLLNRRFYHDLRKYHFSARIVNIWNSLPNNVVDVNTVNVFKTHLIIIIIIIYKQVLGEARCQIRFHGQPNQNWR